MDPRACELRGREPKGGHCDRMRSQPWGSWGRGAREQLGGFKARSNHPEPTLDPTPTKANAG